MRTFAVSLFLTVLLAARLDSGIGQWRSFTYSEDCYAVAAGSAYVNCATSGGLVRYDLVRGTTDKLLPADGLSDVRLLSAEVDQHDNLFIGGSNSTLTKISNRGGITRYLFRYLTEARYNINDLAADGDVLWVATDIGVGKFLIERNGGEFQDVASHLGRIPRETAVRAVLVVNGFVWAGTDSGLAFMATDNIFPQNPQSWRSYRVNENGLTNAKIRSFAAIADTVFVGTEQGVFCFGTDSIWVNVGLSWLVVTALAVGHDQLYAGTTNGIYRRLVSGWEALPTEGLTSTNVRGLDFDSTGQLWAAFASGGLGRWDDSTWQIFTVPGPADNVIFDIALDTSGGIWLSHWASGLSRFDGTNWVIFNHRNSGLGDDGALGLAYDPTHGLLWVSSWGDGLYTFDGRTWVNYDESNSPLQGVSGNPQYVAVPTVAIDEEANAWAVNLDAVNATPGGPNLVMAGFDPDDSLWQPYYENAQQVPDNSLSEIAVSGSNIFLGGRTGIWWLDCGQKRFDVTDDVWHGRIVDMVGVTALGLDTQGRLFIGSASGLAYYDFRVRDTLTVELPDGYRGAVNAIETDGVGNIWIGTDSGVVVLPRDFDRLQPAWLHTFKPSNSPLINNAVLAIEIDKASGIVYLGTGGGGLSIYESGYEEPSPDLSNLDVYPNPVNMRQGHDRASFLRVPIGADIFIYNVAGELVRHFVYDGTSGYWDLTNDAGSLVAGGVYFFYVRRGSSSGSGRIAVIR